MMSHRVVTVDSGAYPHMACGEHSTSMRERDNDKQTEHKTVTQANGDIMRVLRAGQLTLQAANVSLPLNEVLAAEGMKQTLLSVGAYCEQEPGNNVLFTRTHCLLRNDDENILVMKRRANGLYGFKAKTRPGGKAWVTRTRSQHKSMTTEQKVAKRRKVRKEKKQKREQKMEEEAKRRELEGEEEAMLLHTSHHHLNLKELYWMARNGKATCSKQCLEWFRGKTKFDCDCCSLGKVTEQPLPKKSDRVPLPDDGEDRVTVVRVGMDLNGPHVPAVGSHSGKRYALLFRKQKTRYSWLRFLRHKSDAHEQIKRTIKLILATLPEGYRLILLSDLGMEFLSEKTENMLESLGVEHRYTGRNTSLRNGTVERHFRTLEQDAATHSVAAGLAKAYWADLYETAHGMRLHLPCQGLGDHRSPHEAEHNTDSAPYLARFAHPVGCLAVPPRIKRTSIGLRGEELVWLGPALQTKDAHRLLNLSTGKVAIARTRKLHTKIFPAKMDKDMRKQVAADALEEAELLGLAEVEQSLPSLEEESETEVDTDSEEHQPRPRRATGKPDTYQPTLHDQTRQFVKELARTRELARKEAQQKLRTTKSKKQVAGYTLAAALSATAQAEAHMSRTNNQEGDPVNFYEAVKHPHWAAAWDKELNALKKKGVWREEIPPDGANIMGNKVVFKTKRDENNNITKYKARGCGKGFTQIKDVDYNETFAATVRMDTVRMFFKLAAQRSWNMRQADVDNAFLNASIPDDEPLYMEPFPGMKVKPGHKLRLLKALYGTKQAGRLWGKELQGHLRSVGYTPSHDPCLWLKHREGKLVAAVLYHVDDILSGGHDKETAAFIKDLAKRFNISDMGEPKFFLGIRITKVSGGYAWSQDAYVERLLHDAGMQDCNPRKTPSTARLYRHEEAEAMNTKQQKGYRRLVGGLLYLNTCTRPDISVATNQLTRHFSEPQRHHMKAAKHLLAYVAGTKNHGLIFVKEESPKLECWVDADWAGDVTDRKSTSGTLVKIGSSIMSSSCRKQTVVATSTTAAELIALSAACKEVMWQAKLYRQLFEEEPTPIEIFEDNRGAKLIADDPDRFSAKTKHLDIQHFFCQEQVEKGTVFVTAVPTDDQIADILTKPLGAQKFTPLRKRIGVVDCKQLSSDQ